MHPPTVTVAHCTRALHEIFANDFIYGGADQWQVFNFAWVGSSDPSGGNTLYYCEGGAPSGFGDLNNMRYCNEEVDALIKTTDSIVDPEERAAVYNHADALWLADIPMIPMYQLPTFFAWNSAIVGPQDNPTDAGPLWNVARWTGKDIVIFGTDEQPESMNVFEPAANRLTGFIATAVLEGAYTITPDFQYVPVLITSAEPIVPSG